jgi:uncharacterized protein YbjT (DUF2867 family)
MSKYSMKKIDNYQQPQVVITGATGNVGARVVKLLLDRGRRIRLLVRDRMKAQAIFGTDLDLTVGDFSDAPSMSSAFEGVKSVVLITSGPSIPEFDRVAAHAAQSAGVQHLVKLSSYDAEHQVGTGAWHAQGELAIRASGVPFTFVRPSGFMSNALWWADSIKRFGVVRSCTGTGRIAFIHPADIAEVTAGVVLTPELYLGSVLPLTGPQALTYSEMAQKIGLAIRKTVGFEEISETEARNQQMAWCAEPALIEARLSIFRAISEGRLQEVTGKVATILRRPALDFDTWAQQNTPAFT